MTSTAAGQWRPEASRRVHPHSAASAETRATWTAVDTTLVHGAVEHALRRTRAALVRHDLAAALLFDPVNIRYASRTSTMPVWTLHSIDRYLLVPAVGEPGPRTNPWFREASDRRIHAGDLVSFDTDLIGPAGYLADHSRAYLVGGTPTPRQRRLCADAEGFLAETINELRPGVAFDELGERLSRRLPEDCCAQRYPFIAHGSGLTHEYPVIVFSDHHAGEVEPGMVFSVEAYMGVEGESEGVKLEEQVLVSSTGVELLSRAPHDERLCS